MLFTRSPKLTTSPKQSNCRTEKRFALWPTRIGSLPGEKVLYAWFEPYNVRIVDGKYMTTYSRSPIKDVPEGFKPHEWSSRNLTQFYEKSDQ